MLLAAFCAMALLLPIAAPALGDSPVQTIKVVVTDQNGSPIPFADITISASHGNLISHFKANAQGVLTLSGPANTSIQPYGICASASIGNYSYDACSGLLNPAADATITVPLTIILPTGTGAPAAPAVSPRGWVFGTVRAAGSGAPVPGVTVQLANTPVSTTTGPDGHYQFPAISTTDGAGGGPAYTVAVTPPAGFVAAGSASQTVTVVAGQGAEADFTLAPAFVPFWVESFVPGATLWSGSDSKAVAFGARPQWSYFLVVAEQRGPRLEVWDPSTKDYAWVDAAAVGPSGPPAP